MSVKTTEILEQLKSLTLLETSELVKEIEDTFGVDASPRLQFTSCFPLQNDIQPPEPEKTEFDVVVEEVPAERKIAVLKAVRTITGLGLKEAKDIVDSVPRTLNAGIALADAEEIKQQLETAGAKVTLR